MWLCLEKVKGCKTIHMNDVTQGTVIYGIRSEKYPEIMSYAIIISARCDIANNKISKLYYLSAVNVKEWFCTKHGFSETYKEKIGNCKNALKQKFDKYSLNVDLMLSLNKSQVMQILCKNEPSEKKLSKLINEYEKVYNLINANDTNSDRKKLVKEISDLAHKLLTEITKGSINHYFFIPQYTYLNNGVKNNGLMVDLQEIGIIPISDVKRLKSPGIDYKILFNESEYERIRLQEMYWLFDDGDFVGIEGIIQPPWCELLMQRFSNGFTRIGVDAATSTDYMELVDSI